MAVQKGVDDFWECQFLSDPNESRKHEKLLTKNATVLQQKYAQDLQLCTELLNCSELERKVKEAVNSLRKLSLEKEIVDSKLKKGEETTNNIMAEYEGLSLTVSEKQNAVPELAQQADSLKQMVHQVKSDHEKEKKLFKQAYDATIYMKDIYKKNLGCHIRRLKTEDESALYLFTFGSMVKLADNETMPMKSVKLQRIVSGPSTTPNHSKFTTWRLLETNPKIPNFKQIASKLEENQDVQGLLAHLRTVWKSKRLNS